MGQQTFYTWQAAHTLGQFGQHSHDGCSGGGGFFYKEKAKDKDKDKEKEKEKGPVVVAVVVQYEILGISMPLLFVVLLLLLAASLLLSSLVSVCLRVSMCL